MLSLHGKPIIEWVIRRVQKAKLLDDIIVAIPQSEDNDILAKYIREIGVDVYRGSEDNVLHRFYESVQNKQATHIVRVCADNPLIDGKEIDNLIEFYKNNPCDYAYNHIPKDNLYPDGLGAEMISFELLKELNSIVQAQHHKEHCLSYITDNPEKYTIQTFNPADEVLHHPELRFDVDTFDDYYKLCMKDFDIDISSKELINLFTVGEEYISDVKKYNQWNDLKQALNVSHKTIGFNEQDILFISIGQNIGFETYGKGKQFLRPVIVLKKLGKYSFVGIPLSSKIKEGYFYFNINFKKRDNIALLNQIRTFDVKRIQYKIGYLSKQQFEELKAEINLKITPLRRGGAHEGENQPNFNIQDDKSQGAIK